jgi:hypothetical protein
VRSKPATEAIYMLRLGFAGHEKKNRQAGLFDFPTPIGTRRISFVLTL